MPYRLFLILLLISVLPLGTVQAQDSRYRVEVLLLSHIDHDQEPREVRQLEDLSQALDFLTPPTESPAGDDPFAESDEETTAVPLEMPQDGGALEPGEEDSATAEELEEDPLDVVIHIEEMGPEMQEAWRRLRLSAPFRPLQYLAWEQGSREPFPVLRIHDLETVLVEDPWAEQRQELENPEESLVFGDTVATTPEVDSLEPEADAADTLPDPIAYYRLDGTVSLVRTRFLHLSMAIEWREPVFEEIIPPLLADAPAPLPSAADEPPAPPLPSAFLVHRLEQSRPVRTGRMEYFDGPVLGLLAWITDVSDTNAPEATE